MAVPNTTTFSLQDVVNEINPTTDDLVDCIADANSSGYDSSYYTSPATSLLEFRNYVDVATMKAYTIAYGANWQGACGGSSTLTIYQVSNTFNFVDPIYKHSGGTIFADANWYQFEYMSWEWNGFSWIGSAGTGCLV
tara:strand:+ start:1402 stop:1812 length:411 start_codon:yes stop_codon:yes gene_type:complete